MVTGKTLLDTGIQRFSSSEPMMKTETKILLFVLY